MEDIGSDTENPGRSAILASTKDVADISTASKRPHLFFGLNDDQHISGGIATGIVVLVVQSEVIRAKSLHIRWEGHEHASFFQSGGLGTQCTSESAIFSRNQELWSNEKDKGIFAKGTHTFPVSFEVPSAIPTSFDDHESRQLISTFLHAGSKDPEAQTSRVEYSATAVLELAPSKDRKANAPNKLEFRVEFKVFEKLDLLLLTMEPKTKETEKTFLLSKNPMKLKVTLPTGGLCFIGYRLPVNIEVRNGSKKRIEAVRVTLHRLIQLQAKGQVSQRRQCVLDMNLPNTAIEPAANYFDDFNIDVPADLQPSVTLASLIQRKYEVVVSLKIAMNPSDLMVSFPIDVYQPVDQDFEVLQRFRRMSITEEPAELQRSDDVTGPTAGLGDSTEFEPAANVKASPDPVTNATKTTSPNVPKEPKELAGEFFERKRDSWMDVNL